MQKTILLLLPFLLFSCTQNSEHNDQQQLLKRVEQLEAQLAECYQPGFGSSMSNIQAHHLKLWFAGINQNWKLADFEIHEIKESLEDIQKYQKDRSETKLIEMITPSMEEVTQAIKNQNIEPFKNSYTHLTNACNDCHRATQFEYNRVKVPTTQPFGNQVFKIGE